MDSRDFKEVVSTITRLCMKCPEWERIQDDSLISDLGNFEESDAINQENSEIEGDLEGIDYKFSVTY